MPIIDINLILGISFIAWHYSLFCGYISDDHSAVAGRQDIIPDAERVDRKEGFWVKRFNDGIVMFYLNAFMWRMGFRNFPFAWHLLSLSLHLANTYLLYIFLTPVIGEQQALYTSAFWSVSPMSNQNVVWISGRPYLIGIFLGLIALICWDKPYVFLPYYLLALITNVSIFFIPLINYFIHPQDWQSKFYLISMLALGFPIVIWKFNKRFMNGLAIDRENFRFKIRKLNTLARMCLYYMTCIFIPTKMGWYHENGFRYNVKWEKFNYKTLTGYILVFLMVLKFPIPAAIFIFGLLPVSNIYATNSFLQDRYLYFSSIGIAMIVSQLFVAYPFLFYCAMTFYGSRAYMYSRHMKNDETLYRENWRNHPNSDYAINNLSFFLINQGRFDEARVVVERGLNISRTNTMLWYNLGITHAAQGHFNNDEGKFRFIKAIESFKTCLAIEPRWSKPAEDIKKLIKLLVDNKVITLEKSESAGGLSISVPALTGMQEILEGKK